MPRAQWPPRVRNRVERGAVWVQSLKARGSVCQFDLGHGLRALANVTVTTSPCNVTLPGRGTVAHPAEKCHRRAACSFQNQGGHARTLTHLSFPVAPDLSQAVSGLPLRPADLSPSRTRLRAAPADCVTPIHHAEHDCKGVPCRRRSATEIPGMRPFCRPMASILSFLDLLNRYTTHSRRRPVTLDIR